MAHMLDLPSEVLATIITLMVISSGDLREWARLSTVCKAIHNAAIERHFLLWVDCEHLLAITHHEQHHHFNGLLSRCVRVRNPTADLVMAKVILFGGSPLWEKMRANDVIVSKVKSAITMPLSPRRNIAKCLVTGSIADVSLLLFSMEDDESESCESYGRLYHWRLVKSFIALAKPMDLVTMFLRLEDFVICVLGYHVYLESNIKDTLDEMYAYVCYKMILYEHRRIVSKYVPCICLDMYQEELLPDKTSKYRDEVILALDKVIKM